jgi:hypothetical protein
MNKHSIAWLLCAIIANSCHAAEYLAGANYFGAFTTESQDGTSGCAAVDAKNLTPRTPVNIVVLSQPQRIVSGTVTSHASAECTRFFQGSASAVFYDVRLTRGKFQQHELGVLVLPGVALTQAKTGEAVATLGQQRYRFFECSSNEGIHIAVRSEAKEPLTVWHDYLYLGIDVDPTCRPRDYAAMEQLGKAAKRNTPMPAR